ncbi:MAG: NfeD family protein [Oscillospiraceae bacterium]|nr:NfeD family protein [Oscillospiraceae bacterium]
MLFGIPLVYIWLALTLIFVVIEVATTDISSIWFAAGALVSTIVAWLVPDSFMLQAIAFAVVTVAAMYFTKPILTKYITKETPTNMDMYIGKNALVVSAITPDKPGRAKIGGLSWQAKSGQPVAEGEMCKVVKIEGVSLVVEKITVNS